MLLSRGSILGATLPTIAEVPEVKQEEIKQLEKTEIVQDTVDTEVESEVLVEPLISVEPITITLSFAGDFTLGKDAITQVYNTLPRMYEAVGKDPTYFLKNVKEIFSNDDLTFVNLETTLTTATKMQSKKFRFKGAPEYRDILIDGSIEVVNIANNHTMDYLQQGYTDTQANLDLVKIGYVSGSITYIKEVKGVKIGVMGYKGWDNSKTTKDSIAKNIEKLKEVGCEVIAIMFHWGNEKINYPIYPQEDLAKFSIDNGVDVVVGGHAHVLQSLEIYKGKPIVYGLGNFCYGGHSNPPDKDTMIFQQTFTFENGAKSEDLDAKVIPCSITSQADTNNFQPTPLVDTEKARVIDRLNTFSNGRNLEIDPKGVIREKIK